jgi:hypothetical protein
VRCLRSRRALHRWSEKDWSEKEMPAPEKLTPGRAVRRQGEAAVAPAAAIFPESVAGGLCWSKFRPMAAFSPAATRVVPAERLYLPGEEGRPYFSALSAASRSNPGTDHDYRNRMSLDVMNVTQRQVYATAGRIGARRRSTIEIRYRHSGKVRSASRRSDRSSCAFGTSQWPELDSSRR